MNGIIISIIVFAVLVWLIQRGGIQGKRQSVATRLTKSDVNAPAADPARGQGRGNQSRQALKQLREREKLKNKTNVISRINEAITHAGYSFSPTFLIGISIVLTLILFFFVVASLNVSILPSLLIALSGGFFVPRWWLQHVSGKRRKMFLAQFADALDMLVRGAKSGLPLVECLRAVAHESDDPLATEFRLVVDKLAIGAELKMCLAGMYARMPIPEVSFFSVVLSIQGQTGGNLSEALGNLSSVIRARAFMKEKVKALTSESKASSIVLGALPFLVIGLMYFAQPDYIAPLFETSMGNNLLFVAAGLMVVGILTMRRLSKLKI